MCHGPYITKLSKWNDWDESHAEPISHAAGSTWAFLTVAEAHHPWGPENTAVNRLTANLRIGNAARADDIHLSPRGLVSSCYELIRAFCRGMKSTTHLVASNQSHQTLHSLPISSCTFYAPSWKRTRSTAIMPSRLLDRSYSSHTQLRINQSIFVVSAPLPCTAHNSLSRMLCDRSDQLVGPCQADVVFVRSSACPACLLKAFSQDYVPPASSSNSHLATVCHAKRHRCWGL